MRARVTYAREGETPKPPERSLRLGHGKAAPARGGGTEGRPLAGEAALPLAKGQVKGPSGGLGRSTRRQGVGPPRPRHARLWLRVAPGGSGPALWAPLTPRSAWDRGGYSLATRCEATQLRGAGGQRQTLAAPQTAQEAAQAPGELRRCQGHGKPLLGRL